MPFHITKDIDGEKAPLEKFYTPEGFAQNYLKKIRGKNGYESRYPQNR
jgi:hypothetical protein